MSIRRRTTPRTPRQVAAATSRQRKIRRHRSRKGAVDLYEPGARHRRQRRWAFCVFSAASGSARKLLLGRGLLSELLGRLWSGRGLRPRDEPPRTEVLCPVDTERATVGHADANLLVARR